MTFHPIPNLPRGLSGDDLAGRLYVLPMGIVSGPAAAAAVVAGAGWPLCDGALAFTSVGVVLRDGGKAYLAVAPFPEVLIWSENEDEAIARHVARLIHRIGGKRKPWGGMAVDRPLVMGIVNATPDSFSDGGDNFDPATAIANGLAMVEAGADLVDVGGESTRPGAAQVGVDEEIRRVVPVVKALAERGVRVSIDTRHAAVMAAALASGAGIVNDICALEGAGALAVAAGSDAAICLMHMQGEPQTMQADPIYECAPLDVFDYLSARVAACEAAGISRDRLAIDPGIGFGKNVEHNAQVFAALGLYHGLGCPILLGSSRKSFIAKVSRDEPPKQRLAGTVAAHQVGLEAGVQILRVHDVAQAAQAVAVWRAIRGV